MDTWENIKQQIKIETRDYFRPKEIDTDSLIDLLKQVINFPIDEEFKISGLSSNITNALSTFFDDEAGKKDRIAHFQYLKNFEPLLKKIIFIINPEHLKELQSEKEMAIKLLTELNLLPKGLWLDEEHLSRFDDTVYEFHLIKSYLLRNTESHNMEQWSNRDLESNIDTLLIFYLEIINRCKEEFIKKLTYVKNDFNNYIDNEINSFETLAKSFVATRTVEDYSVFESYGIEHKNFTKEENETKLERNGTIDDIRKNKLPEKRMLIWGNAGLGKSTTLQYLTYIDAKSYKAKQSDVIPVYVPLGMLIDIEETIENYIFNKLQINYSDGKDLLDSGKLNIFLDGINEIPEGHNTEKRIREIQYLIDTYKNSLFILTNRPEKFNLLQNIPVFRLQNMDYDRVVDFVTKNSVSSVVSSLIIEKIENNHRLLRSISIPLMTTRLIEIVSEFGKVPESEGEIIKDFLETLYKREILEKKDIRFDIDKINLLLTGLAEYGFVKNSTNSGLSRIEVFDSFKKTLQENYCSYDITYALDTLIKIGILSCNIDGNVVVFAHQAYQDYYLSLSHNHLSQFSIKSENEPISKSDDLQQNLSIELNNKKFEKSITYQLHNMDRESRNEELKSIVQHNIALASDIVASGPIDNEIEKYILDYSKETFSTSDSTGKARCILACLNLEKKDILDSYLNIIITNEDREVLRQLISETNEDQIIDICTSIIHQEVDIQILRDTIEYLGKLIAKKDVKFTWNKLNKSFIYEFADFINDNLSKNTLLKLYLLFNIPKDKIQASVFTYAQENLSRRMYFEQCFNFLQSYDTDFDLSGKIKEIIATDVKDSQKYFYYYKLLENLLIKKQEEQFINTFREDSTFRCIVFIFLDKEIQDSLSNKYNYYYYYEGNNPYILFPEDTKKIADLLERNQLYSEYTKQCKLIDNLQFKYIH